MHQMISLTCWLSAMVSMLSWHIINFLPLLMEWAYRPLVSVELCIKSSLFIPTPSFTRTDLPTHQRDSHPKAMFHPSSSSAPYSDLSMHHAVSLSSAVPTAPTEIPRGGFFHDNGGLLALPNVAASAPPPYPSSLPSYYFHKNTSSYLLPLHLQLSEQLNSNATLSCSSPSASQLPLPHVPSSPSSSSGDFLEFSTGALRRVFSTGDLQVMQHASS